MSKIMMGCACVGTVVGGMYLHGDLDGGNIYNVPVRDAYLRAQNTGVEKMDVGRSGMSYTGTCDIERDVEKSVTYSCSDQGTNIGRVVTSFKDLGDGRTRVWVKFKGGDAEGDSAERTRTFLKKVATVEMSERIGAAIEQREVNREVIASAMSAYLMTNTGDMFAEVASSMNEASANFDRRDDERDYSRAQSSAGKPTVNLDKKSSY